ncbi:MAG TPA: conjugal transfer protein [Symbiobacteriaceae bacterium]|nr:conjugal transfer protein [Symbiobacteriaceae bacterium]
MRNRGNEATAQDPGADLTDTGDAARTLMTSFFRAYFVQAAGDMRYFLAPGTSLRTPDSVWQFDEVTQFRLVQAGEETRALAQVQVTDPLTEARYTLSFTAVLQQRDGRWYIHDLIQKGA